MSIQRKDRKKVPNGSEKELSGLWKRDGNETRKEQGSSKTFIYRVLNKCKEG
jgi:hypothetical protein